MNNPNLKINPKYKLMMLVSLLLATGCTQYEHKNIILDMKKDGTKGEFLIQDVETGTKRIFKVDEHSYGYHVSGWQSDYDYLTKGDPVTIVVGGIYSDKAYTDYRVLSSNDLTLRYNTDSVFNRRQRERFAKEKTKFDNMEQNMLGGMNK